MGGGGGRFLPSLLPATAINAMVSAIKMNIWSGNGTVAVGHFINKTWPESVLHCYQTRGLKRVWEKKNFPLCVEAKLSFLTFLEISHLTWLWLVFVLVTLMDWTWYGSGFTLYFLILWRTMTFLKHLKSKIESGTVRRVLQYNRHSTHGRFSVSAQCLVGLCQAGLSGLAWLACRGIFITQRLTRRARMGGGNWGDKGSHWQLTRNVELLKLALKVTIWFQQGWRKYVQAAYRFSPAVFFQISKISLYLFQLWAVPKIFPNWCKTPFYLNFKQFSPIYLHDFQNHPCFQFFILYTTFKASVSPAVKCGKLFRQ